MRLRTSSTSITNVLGSTSQKTGLAINIKAGVIDPIQVYVGQITSSPGPTPRPNIALCKAAVPFVVHTAYSVL